MAKRKVTKAKAKRTVKRSKAKRSKARKPAARKRIAKKVKGRAVKRAGLEATLEKIGEVTHYFPHVKAAAVLMLKDGLKIRDVIYIKGHTTDFKEKVSSIQLDRAPIQVASKSQEIGLLVKSRVRIGDSVYKV